MSRTNDVHSEIWADEDFLDLSPHAKLVYFWSFTNADCGMAGVYRVARQQMAGATGLTRDEVVAALADLESARFILYVDGTLFVRARVKRLRSKNDNIAKSIAGTIKRLREVHPIRRAFLAEYANFPWPRLQLELKDLQIEVSQEPPMEPLDTSGNLAEVPRRGGVKAQASVVEGSSSAGRAGAHEATSAVHPQLDAVLALFEPHCPPLELTDAAVNRMLLRAHREGVDVLTIADNALASFHAHGDQHRVRRVDLLLKGEIDRAQERAGSDLAGLRSAGDAARTGASRAGKPSIHERLAERDREIAELRRQEELEEQGEAA